ncbi:M4 family metallopeptidase [Oscillochloris sp. ZM17-4]|uniref:M4 family metallopeptidase n=1 Tax=Oscillochloris sp. ZM17-4 TaxID=2866714 RepID=UPI001C738717|nr:M4 family metallopeptidase [Oscillochloris sp. ZM17-4]MBX0328483.1 M4 family metallopeptidase [Oscillochloris sp. ZM17-4]
MKRSAPLRLTPLPILLLALAYLAASAPLLLSPSSARSLRLTPPLITPAAAQAPLVGDVSPAAAFASLQAQSAQPLAVRWDERSGIPAFLSAANPAGRLHYRPTAAEIGNPLAIARGFLDANRALFGLRAAADDLGLLRVEPDLQRGFAHVRLDQRYAGLPVLGHQLVVHLDPDGQVVAVNGEFAPALQLVTAATISAADAEAAALANLTAEQLAPGDAASAQVTPLPEETRLAISVDDQGQASLVWEVMLLTERPLSQWRFFVNAGRPVVVHAIDEVMPIKRRRTYSARNGTSIPGRLLVDEGERSRDAVAQAAHDGAGVVYDYYMKTFQRDAYDGQGSPMISTVHYGSDPEDAENAAWVGEYSQMIYGDGGKIFKPLPYGLDVVGHEFTHGVIESSAGLIYEKQPGALNESYADVFGALIDRGNWTIGEQVVKSPPYPVPYLRSMQDPNAGGRYDKGDPLSSVGQPASMKEYANLPNSRRSDNGGVHVNSGIPNRAAYLVAQALGPEKMEQIYYRTLTQYLSPSADFKDAADATAQAAADLYGNAEVAAVRAAFAQVGITTSAAPSAPPPVAPGSDLPSGGPSAPPPVEALPAGCTDVIVNGDFEQDGGWTQVSRGDAALIDTQLPRSGKRSAWLGGTDQEPLQYIYQDVRLPANATSAQLSYARLVHEEFSGLLGLLADDAKFSVALAGPSGDILATVEEIPSSAGDDTWSEQSADLSAYAGKTVRLAFAAENPRGNISSMFVDEVKLVVCTTGQAPSAPPTSSSDLVYIRGAITDADTHRGVAGAQFFVIKTGVTASQAAADDNLTADEILTLGTTDDSGVFRTSAAIPRGQSYSVIVFARGYRPILADGQVAVPANASNPHRVDAEIRKSR